MHGTFRILTVAVVCAVLVLLPGIPAWLHGDGQPGNKIIYNLYATDGYARLGDGSTIHFYGFIGGRDGAPFAFADEAGALQSVDDGPPPPTAGPVTPLEARLVGHAQLVAPLIWASSDDVVEVRLKNLGPAGSTATVLAPLGIEMRGLAAGFAGDGVPETSRLAAPSNQVSPDAGGVLSYNFRVSMPGTYAYGWDYAGHMGHLGTQDASSDAGAAQQLTTCRLMPTSCICRCGMAMGSAQGVSMTGDAPLYSALDGALVIYNPADRAAQTGPGMGSDGVLLGLPYDADYVSLISGGAAAQTAFAASSAMAGMAGMAGMAAIDPYSRLLVNGSLAAAADQPAGGLRIGVASQPGSSLPNYRSFSGLNPAGRGASHVLVRIVNVSAQPQPVQAHIGDSRIIGYQARKLAWAEPFVVASSWAEGSELVSSAPAANLVVGPGMSLDVLLDLNAVLAGAPVSKLPVASFDVVKVPQ